MKLLETLVRFTDWLLRSSWQASVLIVLVLLVQWVFRKQLAPRWHYAFWLLVLLRLALPLAPESSVSVFNLAPKAWAKNFSQDHRASEVQPVIATAPVSESSLPLSNENAETNAAVLASSSSTNDKIGRAALGQPPDGEMRRSRPTDTGGSNASLILSILWLFGALLFGAFTFWFPLRLNRQLANQHSLVNPAVREVLADCQRVMRVRRVLPVVQSQAVRGPALMGFIRPWLLLPEGMLEKFTPEELRFVFLHELAHLKRRDIAVNWLMTFLLILHWFNPLVWFAFARMRADRELACDALALSYANERDAKPYGQTILKLLDGFTRPAVVAGLVGILEDKLQMKERITMIAQFKKSSGWPVAAVALIALLGCVSLTDGKKQNAGAVNRSGADPGVTAVGGRMNAQPVVRLVASDRIDRWVAYGPATPSPNGKYLAYVNWTHGNLACYNIETGELRDLTTEGTWNGNPDQSADDGGIWSPDSTQIAYLWWKGTNGTAIRIVHRDGGKFRVLVPANLSPQGWTKDGQHIIALGPYRNLTPTSPQTPEGIVRVEVSTGRTSMIKQLPDANRWTSLALSPDGKYIAYSYPRKSDISTNALHHDIRIVNADGSNDRTLIEHPANDSSPQWMPDGKHLLFLSDRSGSVGIWAVPTSSGQLAGEARMVRESVEGREFRISDDGSVHYFTTSPRFNIYVAEANFDEGKIGTPKLVSLRYEGRNRNPRWSSDGSKLGYISWRDPAFLVFQDLATGKEDDVKTEWGVGMIGAPPSGWWPVWSSDLGRLVGPAGSAKKQGRSLVQVEVKGGRRSTVDEVGAVDCWMSVFTPDGKYLIYNRGGRHPKGPGLFELNLATKEERVISQKSDFGVISPDGLQMTECRVPYPAKVGDTIKLVLASRTDGAIKTVAEFPIADKDRGAGHVCDWLPDNRRVIISLEANESDQLYLVDTETGSSRPIDLPLPKGERIRNLTVHPDGKRIALERGRMIRELWSIKNFLLEEKLAAK